MNKRGYFFMVDAIIASVILFVGLFALFGSSVRGESTEQPLVAIEDLAASLATQPVGATLDPYYLSALLPANLVPYPEATPLEEIAYLLYANCGAVNCTDHAKNYTLSLLDTSLGSNYGASIEINGTLVAQQAHTQHYQLKRSLVVYTRLNDTTFIGPLTAQVALWS